MHDATFNVIKPFGFLYPNPSHFFFSDIPLNTAQTSACFPSPCPWLFQPLPGQYYQLTFYIFVRFTPQETNKVFSHHTNSTQIYQKEELSMYSSSQTPLNSCHKLAKVVDKSNLLSQDVLACGKKEVKRHKNKDNIYETWQKYVLASSRVERIHTAVSAIVEVMPYPLWSPNDAVKSPETQIEFLLEFNRE